MNLDKNKFTFEFKDSELPEGKSRIMSAFEKSRLSAPNQSDCSSKGQKHKVSKIATLNSFENEAMDVPVQIRHNSACEMCQVCGSMVDKRSTFVLSKEDPKITQSYLKLFKSKLPEMRICFICFG